MSKAAELAALIGSQTALSNRNLIINGAMQVWQRGTTTDTITSGNYLCDHWRVAHSGTDGNVDVDRSTDVPSGQGFAYSQKISMDASETSLDAADQVNIAQRFEGQDLQQLAKGTSSAKSLTLSFWVKSSVASTYSVNLYDNDNTRVISASYTVSATNTWEKKTITFAGDTTGALDNDNARSLDLTFWLDAGTDWTGGSFGTSWAASVDNTRVYDTTGWLESASPEFYITGVQLEVGEQDTPFEHRSYGDELRRCQRYFYSTDDSGNTTNYINGGVESSTDAAMGGFVFPTQMRSVPTVAFLGTNVTKFFSAATSTDSSVSISTNRSGKDVGAFIVTGFTGATAGQVATVFNGGSGSGITFDAEL